MRNNKMMNPVQAYVAFWGNFFTLNGRAPRSEFWWAMLINSLITWFFSMVAKTLPNNRGTVFIIVWSVAILIPTWTMITRRFHDIDWPGWTPSLIAALFFLCRTFVYVFAFDYSSLHQLKTGLLKEYWTHGQIMQSLQVHLGSHAISALTFLMGKYFIYLLILALAVIACLPSRGLGHIDD